LCAAIGAAELLTWGGSEGLPSAGTTAMVLEKVLIADQAGPLGRKLYENSHMALAGLVPVAALGHDGSTLTRFADLALGVVIPIHSHIAVNGVISDYVPKTYIGASRYVALGTSIVALVGLTKLNLEGPGISATVKSLWRRPEKETSS